MDKFQTVSEFFEKNIIKKACLIGIITNGIAVTTNSKGAVITANAIVNRNIPENAIAGDVPARILKYRN